MAALGTTLASGSVLNDRFALGRLLGVGASARVFLATDLRLQCQVAVKVLHENLAADARFVAQLRREARLAASLEHDHIVTIIDSGETGSEGSAIPYIASEFMAGGSLGSILDGEVTLEPEQVAALGSQAARALAYAHREGVIHRDIKPSNLLFDADGRLALADFGIARAVAEASATEPADSGAGATRYASPEAVMGRSAQPRSDVYSLGLVLLECLTGEVPLLGDSPVATMGRRVGEPVEVPRLPGSLGAALSAATRRDPEDRSDAKVLAEMLATASEDLGEPGPLPLRPMVSGSDDTAELTIDRSDGSVKILGVAPVGAAAARRAPLDDPGPSSNEARAFAHVEDVGVEHSHIDLTDSGDPTGADDAGGADDASAFGRDAITVAEEYHALDASRPGPHGVVEPLDVSMTPAPLDATRGRSGRARSDARRFAGGDPTAPVTPEPGRSRRWIALIALIAVLLGGAAGVAWWFLVRVPTHEVPDWVGSDITEVSEAVESNGWELGEVGHERRDGTTAGQVLAQDPAPGTELPEGERISLSVSDGPTLTAIPALVGVPEAEAVAQLEAAGLVPGNRTSSYDETVASGSVVDAAPAEGGEAPDDAGQVPKGTVIDYVVSDGPAPRRVPEGIVGVPLADAEAALEAVQLQSSTSEQYSSEVDEGYVISADVEPGAELARDSVVALVVSAGPEPIVVPDVTGQSGSAAAAALEAAGFTVSGIEGSPSGAVLATDPPAGESRLPGSSVRIFTRTS